MAKNLNKVRTIHPVGRIVYCKDEKKLNLFYRVYKDKMYKVHREPSIVGTWDSNKVNGDYLMMFTMTKNDWNEVVEFLGDGLKPIITEYRKTRYWRLGA